MNFLSVYINYGELVKWKGDMHTVHSGGGGDGESRIAAASGFKHHLMIPNRRAHQGGDLYAFFAFPPFDQEHP